LRSLDERIAGEGCRLKGPFSDVLTLICENHGLARSCNDRRQLYRVRIRAEELWQIVLRANWGKRKKFTEELSLDADKNADRDDRENLDLLNSEKKVNRPGAD